MQYTNTIELNGAITLLTSEWETKRMKRVQMVKQL